MITSEQEKPQLHMVWPASERRSCPAVDPAPGYTIRTYQDGDEEDFLRLMSLSDFDPWDEAKLSDNINQIIPGGWFFAVDGAGQIVATAMAQHNYSGSSPFTGDVGWVFCHPGYRGHALGLALCARVTQRFLEAGYTKIQIHTEYYRLPAIKTYLKLGFAPSVASSEDADFWAEVREQLEWPYEPDNWKVWEM